MADLENFVSRENSWTLTSLVASGASEPAYPTMFHFSAGGKKGDESFEGENLLINDTAAYRAFYEELSAELKLKFDMDSDHQKYHGATSSNIFARRYSAGKECKNNILLRTAWSACLWDSRRIAIAKTIADVMNKHFNSGNEIIYDANLKVKKIGY
jgi:voltage-gated potassium channel